MDGGLVCLIFFIMERIYKDINTCFCHFYKKIHHFSYKIKTRKKTRKRRRKRRRRGREKKFKRRRKGVTHTNHHKKKGGILKGRGKRGRGRRKRGGWVGGEEGRRGAIEVKEVNGERESI